MAEADRAAVARACLGAAREFDYVLTDLAVEPWHAHWIITHQRDAVAVMAGRLKTRMRQALGQGRVWTAGFCHRRLASDEALAVARRYVARHQGCVMSAGRWLD